MFKPPATDNWQTEDFNSIFNLFDAELKEKSWPQWWRISSTIFKIWGKIFSKYSYGETELQWKIEIQHGIFPLLSKKLSDGTEAWRISGELG